MLTPRLPSPLPFPRILLVKGLIADRNVTLGDLIGVLNLFFQKLGIKKIRFKVTDRRNRKIAVVLGGCRSLL